VVAVGNVEVCNARKPALQFVKGIWIGDGKDLVDSALRGRNLCIRFFAPCDQRFDE
jgi:hypothetical protein